MHPDAVAGSRVRLTSLKQFAFETLPEGLLRDDILSQPDEILAEDYLANCRVWLRLARLRRD